MAHLVLYLWPKFQLGHLSFFLSLWFLCFKTVKVVIKRKYVSKSSFFNIMDYSYLKYKWPKWFIKKMTKVREKNNKSANWNFGQKLCYHKFFFFAICVFVPYKIWVFFFTPLKKFTYFCSPSFIFSINFSPSCHL